MFGGDGVKDIALYKNILSSIIKEKGENVEFISDHAPFHSDATFKVVHDGKEFIFYVFVDGSLSNGFCDFDYITLIAHEGYEYFDFDILDEKKIDPFAYDMKPLYDDSLIVKYFHNAFLEWEKNHA
jgi:hypothetical protein